MKDFLLFSGVSNRPLAEKVAKLLGVSLGKVDLTRFADGELRPWIQEDVRDKTVFVIESLSFPMDEHIMEMSLMGDAIRRGAPKTMIAVIPYLGYSRQDKQHRVGEPVSARVIAKFLEVSRYREVIIVELHNEAIVGFFQIPVIHISTLPLFAEHLRSMKISDGVVVSPDVGGVKRARNLAYMLDLPMVVMEKKRFLDRSDTTESFQIIGDVTGKTAIIIDDVISTGGTITHSVRSLSEAGASKIIVCAAHGIFAADAIGQLRGSNVEKIIITDTIVVSREKQLPQLATLSVAPLLANAIGTILR